ncbi:MAG: endoribonuclease MazF [Candidatus Omnitrophota bacterium]
MVKKFIPSRGDVVWLSFDPQAGHEQSGHRPALVLSPLEYNRLTGLALCCPLTSRVKGYPFEVAVPAGLPVEGVVLADQIKCLDWKSRQAKLCCHFPDQAVLEVLAKLNTLIV